MALEVLIHPRSLPLADFPSAKSSHEVNHGFPEMLFSGGQKPSIPFSSGIQEIRHGSSDSDDDLESWLGGSKETDTPVDGQGKNINITKPSEYVGVQAGSLATSPGRSKEELKIAHADVEMGNFGDEIVDGSQQVQEHMMQLRGQTSLKGATTSEVRDDLKVPELELTRVASETGGLVSTDKEIAPVQAGITDGGNETAPTSSTALKESVFGFESDGDSSAETFPDIVDADPDSD